MILRDNTKYSFTSGNLDEYLMLQNIANKKMSDLLDENGNDLLIYPHSFYQCEDEAGKQHLFSLQSQWKGQQCTKLQLETGNMVGFIGMNGKSVSIHSRFSKNDREDFFLHYILSKVMCINLFNLPHGTTDEQIFISYYFCSRNFLTKPCLKEYTKNTNGMNIMIPMCEVL